MVRRGEIIDETWKRIAPLLPEGGRRGGRRKDHRRVVNGILWVLCSGAAWRDLPGRYGPFQTVHRRHLRWRRDGTRERVLRGLRVQADGRGLIDWVQWNADSTSVRATRHAAGAREKGGPCRASRRTTPWAAAAAGSGPSCTC